MTDRHLRGHRYDLLRRHADPDFVERTHIFLVRDFVTIWQLLWRPTNFVRAARPRTWVPCLRAWHHAGTVVRPTCDCRLVHIQMLGNQRRRRMRQPVGKGDLFIAGSPEHPDELQVRVADILDVMSEIAL